MDISANQYTERIKPPESSSRSPFWEEHEIEGQIDIHNPYASLEAQLGHLMMFGKITAEQAYDMI